MHPSTDYVERFAREVYQKTVPREERYFTNAKAFADWVREELGDRPNRNWHLWLTDYPEKPAQWVEVPDVSLIIRRLYG
ncbi:hypothetical protein OAL32_00350 [Synechococcus sp. AH-551-G15]|nr:hypothetical protein [Synechococcus sp. AH-551-G15]